MIHHPGVSLNEEKGQGTVYKYAEKCITHCCHDHTRTQYNTVFSWEATYYDHTGMG